MARRTTAGSSRRGRGGKLAKSKISSRKARSKPSSISELREQLKLRDVELRAAREQQTASADVLKVISRSTFDLDTVLTALTQSAARLCHASWGTVFLREGDVLRVKSHSGMRAEFFEFLRANPIAASPRTLTGRTLLTGEVTHIPDVLADPEYNFGAAPQVGQFRAALGVPLLREGRVEGVFALSRPEPGAFSSREIELVRTFADQAVIAIENARLFEEVQAKTRDLEESLQQQTATADVLKVISRSAFDLDTVLTALVASAARLCGAERGLIFLRRGSLFHSVANFGFSPELEAFARANPLPADGTSTTARAGASGSPVQAVDLLADPSQGQLAREYQRLGGHRTNLGVPLRRDGETIGVFTLTRQVVQAFTERQIELVQTFADQAVIAIQNVNLFEEVQARTRDLEESLQQQIATADVLQVISASPGDLELVFNKLLESATRVCGANFGTMNLVEGDSIRGVAFYNAPPDFVAKRRDKLIRFRPESGQGIVARTRKYVHIDDLRDTPAYIARDPAVVGMADLAGTRTVVIVPMLKEGKLIGTISIYRREVKPFTEKQIALLGNFANQAVIAIENTRLLKELQEKTHELTESLTYQTGSASILSVIASSPTDVTPVLKAIVKSACKVCDAYDAVVVLKDGSDLRFDAHHGPIPTGLTRWPINRRWTAGRAFVDQKTVHVHDLLADENAEEFPDGREMSHRMGHRTTLSVPLLREGESIGAIVLRRTEMNPFSEKQIALLETFADQAVIAINNTRLFDEVQAKTRDLEQSLQQQTATTDVLKVISASPGELQPVFQAMLENAVRLCEAQFAMMLLFEDGQFRAVAEWNLPPAYGEFLENNTIRADPKIPLGRVLQTKQPVQVDDLLADQTYLERFPGIVAVAELGGARTLVQVPMLNEGELVGTIGIYRQEVRPFTDKQIALVQNFAAQGVIAIENARLINETAEALERQTATADVLKVIASSPTDLRPVFDAIAERSNQLIGGHATSAFRFIDGSVELMAFTPVSPEADAALQASYPRPVADYPTFRRVRLGEVVEIRDTFSDEAAALNSRLRGVSVARGFRSILNVPMNGEAGTIGQISVTRAEPGGFAQHHIDLLRTFADQAVIAIQNVSLFEDVQAKTRELSESLKQQTATSEVLEVISTSPGELDPVFHKMLENACRVCEANFGVMQLWDGKNFNSPAAYNVPPALAALRLNKPIRPDPRSGLYAAMETHRVVHRHDLRESEGYLAGVSNVVEMANVGGARTIVIVPMLKEDQFVGVITIYRQEVRPFTDKQIALVQNFTKQAVIAIENARLLKELQEKTRELTESLTYQTGSANILSVIASSPTDVAPVLKAIVESACEVCDAHDAVVFLKEDDHLHFSAHHGPIPFGIDKRWPINRRWVAGRAFLDQQPVQVEDLQSDDSDEFIEGRDMARENGHRTVLSVPLLRENESVGVIALRRDEVRLFNEKQIALLQTFADQAVIAIGNARLFEQVQQRTQELSQSLDDLRAAQDRLVQTEKLASLGQLTAGIAHEIKNPLNFVNNFAGLSGELIDELNEMLGGIAADQKKRDELNELTQTLKSNLEKITQHGQRADSIVKNMLLHSREGSGEQRPVDVNALVDEGLNLAYHGARAEKPGFHITLQRKLDPAAGQADVFPQEVTRVLLNLISNGFYAATRRAAEAANGFEPTLSAETRNLGDRVEIRIRDNGTGMPADVKAKIFTPFFTTKPPGEGTGLGLSMSHDIIVKQHGGSIDVETEPGAFTEFIITLPRQALDKKKIGGQT